MKLSRSIVNRVTSLCTARQGSAFIAAHEATKRIPGWSNIGHYFFFHALLESLPGARILVCGVYHGLDLALIDLAAKAIGQPPARVVGVDLFSSEPCADWPEEKRGMTWQQAFNCPPPDIEAARKACPSAEIVQANSIEYLRAHAGEFDIIYLDTSHDEKTVRDELAAALCSVRTRIIAGDDYAGPGNFSCGVECAVTSLLPDHLVLFNRIWFATQPHLFVAA